MKYISLFSGIEAASVAWESLGWTPVAFSEIDDFSSELLNQKIPNVPNLGDITKIDWSNYAGEIDLIVGGSPCQSFSVAGDRTGLDGASGLMWEYVRAVREIRPRWFVWENVPGVLSSSKGEDFRCLLKSMDELGYCLAWRVLDAQFFGVAQRRRRVFLVGSLGNRRAADVLFESGSLQWDSKTSREKREELTGNAENSIGKYLPLDTTQITNPSSGSNPKWDDPCHTLCASAHVPAVICLTGDNANAAIDINMTGTLTAHDAKGAPSILSNGYVRRLTPKECERLQGFPDDWTLINWNGKESPKTRRYKAIGNSMAVSVMKWIGERIDKIERVI